jgi:hypothetical protein
MSTAEQMGRVLQRTAISTNIKVLHLHLSDNHALHVHCILQVICSGAIAVYSINSPHSKTLCYFETHVFAVCRKTWEFFCFSAYSELWILRYPARRYRSGIRTHDPLVESLTS